MHTVHMHTPRWPHTHTHMHSAQCTVHIWVKQASAQNFLDTLVGGDVTEHAPRYGDAGHHAAELPMARATDDWLNPDYGAHMLC